MDPVTIVVSALVAGAAASLQKVAGQAIVDGYNALKALILRKFGKPDVASAVEGVEKKPDSEGRRQTLKEELDTAGVGKDDEVVRLARSLLDLLQEHGLPAGPSYSAELRGSGAIAQGPGAAAAGRRGIAIGGNVQSSVLNTGDNSTVNLPDRDES